MISKALSIIHPQLPGVSVFLVSGQAVRGRPQQVLVSIDPGAVIPLHQHDADASMFVLAGNARLITCDQLNGKEVSIGDVVEFARLHNHGFEAGPVGMSFLSTNGGIVDADGNWDFTMNGGK
jgi:quercetin dioxygenase-like cupin family protein